MMGEQQYPIEKQERTQLRFPERLTIVGSQPHIDRLVANLSDEERGELSLTALDLEAPLPDGILERASCIVIEVDPAVRASLDRIEVIARKAPNLPRIAALANADVSLIRTLIKQGVADVVSLPFAPDEILQASISAAEDEARASRKPVKEAPVIAVVRAVGGSGATTIATHLADELGREKSSERGACLIDLDVQYGAAASAIGLSPRRTLHDLLVAGDRMDASFLRAIALEKSPHLDVIAAPDEIVPLETIETDYLLKVIDIAKREYDYVVLDMPSNWTSWNLSTVLAADEILMVVELNIASLRQAKRRIELFRSFGVDPKRISVVVNRVEKKLFRTIGLDDVAKTLNLDVLIGMTRENELLITAQDQGQFARQIQRKSKFANDVVKLADIVAGRCGQERLS
ncbi:CpaE family protein [Altererythrobacter sp. MF3-039]|uniref:AAA family ATPase n=1 Tax=Altererythrobacter sp. MF3-039 TaxID=3252901 RepID=UPI00390C8AAA